jgi:hypothetical protein
MTGEVRGSGGKNIVAGVFFTLFGMITFFWAQRYEIGTALNMGPGYYPSLCGIVLTALGVVAIYRGVRIGVTNPFRAVDVRPLLLIVAGIVGFGLVIERTGLLSAIGICTLLCCAGRIRTRPIEVALIFAGLALFCSVVFVYIFGMPVAIWK